MSGVRGKYVAACALVVVAAAVAFGAEKRAVNVDGEGVAVKGYDVVAYATAGAATKGDRRYEYEWNGANWRFASAGNRESFAREPQKFAPQFGGYCSWAVSRGYTADIDPEAWRIVDGKLYLNYSKSVQQRWEQDVTGNILKAQANWPGVLAR